MRNYSLLLSDSFLSIGLLFQDKVESFQTINLPFEPAQSHSTGEWLRGSTTYVEFYHDVDQYVQVRVIYTLLAFLRDIGGLFGAFNGIFGGIIFILTFNALYQQLTSRLYRVNVLSGIDGN